VHLLSLLLIVASLSPASVVLNNTLTHPNHAIVADGPEWPPTVGPTDGPEWPPTVGGTDGTESPLTST